MTSDPRDQRHLLSLSGYEIINLLQHGLVEPTHPDLAVLRTALCIPSEQMRQQSVIVSEEERYQAYERSQKQKTIRAVEDELEAWCKLRCKLI